MNRENITEWIDGIINDLASENIRLVNILRKINILTFKIKNEKLKIWVNHELNGYSGSDELPAYRIIPCEVKGNLVQSNIRGIITANNRRIPVELLGQDIIDYQLYKVDVRQGIAEIESINDNRDDCVCFELPFYVIMQLERANIVKNFHIENAWLAVIKPSISSILESLKNHLLEFLLQLNDEIGNPNKDFTIMKNKNKFDEIFEKTIGNISGNNNVNISVGDNSIQTTTNDSASTHIEQKIENQVYSDDKLIKDLKELLEIFRKLENEHKDDLEDVEEFRGELARIEVQTNKETPKRNIIKQSLDVIKTMTVNIASNASTDTVVGKINSIIKWLE